MTVTESPDVPPRRTAREHYGTPGVSVADDEQAAAMTTPAHLELLVVPNCSNEHEAAATFRRALAAAGYERATFDTVQINTQQQAEERGFSGSPSFYINGYDVLPNTAASPALACRMYRSESGTLAGTPDSETLAAVIRRI